MLAEGRWLLTAAEDQPMQPDLPAGFFAELLWTAAACLAAIVQRSGLIEAESVVPLVEAAAQRQLARHDEATGPRSEEHTSELQSLMRISYAVFCLKKKKKIINYN